MMKKLFTLYLIICYICVVTSSAQVGEWTWLHGSATSNQAGNFGTKGVPSASNEPPSLYEPCEWTDLNGNFWMYGGIDENSFTHNDLWEYNPITNMWTWMSGTNTPGDSGNYGVQGVPSASNRPPCRAWGVASFVDLNGNLWMFGGSEGTWQGFNDLWMYDISSNIWTWMKGTNTPADSGHWGTKGVPNITNIPYARIETDASWTDNSGDFWLFGGGGMGTNDLWRYNIATNTWTWMKGSNIRFQLAIYGIMGTEDSANTPSNRWVHCRWKDKSGNLWLFGGLLGSIMPTNELWRYNPTTNNWTWMNGSSSYENGVYGIKCVTSSTNTPGSRYESRAAWVDTTGNFWMFGGSITGNGDMMNDLWMYCVTSNQWTWESGDSTPNSTGHWGSLGVTSPLNIPSGRMGSVGWTDHKGHLYLFGGSSAPWPAMMNDLWEFAIDPNCGACNTVILPPVANFQSSDSNFCSSECINYTDLSTNATSWQWSFPGGTPSSSTIQNPQGICYDSAGTFDSRLIASNGTGTDTLTFTNHIKVFASPPTPVIRQHHDSLFCTTDPTYTSYQWYDSTTLIPGATDTFFVVTHGGNYNVAVANENGCKISVGITIANNVGINEFSANNFISLSPNPASTQLTIHTLFSSISRTAAVSIMNVLGQEVLRPTSLQWKGQDAAIDISKLMAGMYFLEMKTESAIDTKRFVKE